MIGNLYQNTILVKKYRIWLNKYTPPSGWGLPTEAKTSKINLGPTPNGLDFNTRLI